MRASRGQALVLMSMTLLLLTLMVIGTISIGMKTREKIELQNGADAAAYSQSVMTARAYNELSILNRLATSYWVAQAAKQSLISFTGAVRGGLDNGAQAADQIASDNARQETCDNDSPPNCTCTANCGCEGDVSADATALAEALREADSSISSDWDDMDEAAGTDARNLQDVGGIPGTTGSEDQPTIPTLPFQATPAFQPAEIRENLFWRLRHAIVAEAVAKSMSRAANPTNSGDEVIVVPGMAGVISQREVDCSLDGGHDTSGNGSDNGAGICSNSSWNTDMMHAAMGARTNAWVRARGETRNVLGISEFNIGGHDDDTVAVNTTGSGHWGDGAMHGAVGNSHEKAIGEDHATVTVTVRANGCSGSASRSFNAFVESTHDGDDSDRHSYGVENDAQPDEFHTMGSCGAGCPSVWVRTLFFAPRESGGGLDRNDLYGQPKNFAVLMRNYSVRSTAPGQADPWVRDFGFSLSGSAPPTRFKNSEMNTMNSARQVAIASGFTYYHRRDRFNEHPNLLNPFWRATLISADADSTGRADLRESLTGANDTAFNKLYLKGFRGIH